MSTQGIVLIDLVGLGLIAMLLNLVRVGRLHVAHAALWLVAVVGLIILVSVPPLLAFVTVLVGATYPASAVSLLAFVFIFVVLVFFSVQLSTLMDRQVKLVQSLALKSLMEDALPPAAGANQPSVSRSGPDMSRSPASEDTRSGDRSGAGDDAGR
jgi:hypothetical protein